MNRTPYSPAFAKHVRGKLKARFQLDADGDPLYVEDDGLRHYQLELTLESPRAAEIDSVTYILDDPTYYDPVAQSDDSDNDFREEITSYGDFQVLVRVQIGGHEYEQRAWLSNMLEEGYADQTTPSVRNALNRIKAN